LILNDAERLEAIRISKHNDYCRAAGIWTNDVAPATAPQPSSQHRLGQRYKQVDSGPYGGVTPSGSGCPVGPGACMVSLAQRLPTTKSIWTQVPGLDLRPLR
jgi:hypothetical protein